MEANSKVETKLQERIAELKRASEELKQAAAALKAWERRLEAQEAYLDRVEEVLLDLTDDDETAVQHEQPMDLGWLENLYELKDTRNA